MLKISDYDYKIEEAYLDAYIDVGPSLVWGFEISGVREISEEDLVPPAVRIYTHECDSFSSKAGSINAWQDIVGTKIALKDSYDDEADVLVYIGEHVELTRGYFEVYRDSNNTIRLRINGKCNSGYGNDLEIKVDAPVYFKGVLSGRLGQQESLKAVSEILDPVDFNYIQDKNGASICVPKNQT